MSRKMSQLHRSLHLCISMQRLAPVDICIYDIYMYIYIYTYIDTWYIYMGESQMHLPRSTFKNEPNTEVSTSRAGYGGVATDAICLGRWRLDLIISCCVLALSISCCVYSVIPWGEACCKNTAIHHRCATVVSQELELAAALKMFGLWAALLFCPRPPNI